MADPVIFDFDEQSVRVAIIEGEPWFVGRDVCRCLGISNESDALGRLDDDERRDGVDITDPIGRKQQPILISEPGVYNLVFTSRTEAATKFKRWLAHEVLPALRRTGSYTLAEHSAVGPAATASDDGVSPLDIDDVRKCYAILDVHRRLFGRRAAAEFARQLPIPSAAIATFPVVGLGGVARFAGDMLVLDDASRTDSGDIWRAYLGWCGRSGAEPVTRTMLGRRLRELGWVKVKTNGRCVYGGMALAAPRPDAA